MGQKVFPCLLTLIWKHLAGSSFSDQVSLPCSSVCTTASPQPGVAFGHKSACTSLLAAFQLQGKTYTEPDSGTKYL